MRRVFDHKHAVDDERGALSGGKLMGIGVGGAVDKVVWVENDDVGAKVFPQKPAVLELQGLRTSGWRPDPHFRPLWCRGNTHKRSSVVP